MSTRFADTSLASQKLAASNGPLIWNRSSSEASQRVQPARGTKHCGLAALPAELHPLAACWKEML
jgi:hypothetical protein